MSYTVYTVYWENKLTETRKAHGSYASEDEARQAIYTWWEIHHEHYDHIDEVRTNSGALEISYDNPNYVYRIEEEPRENPLPKQGYKLRTAGEIEARRKQLNVDEETFLFDELPEPYRDRLIIAMSTGEKAREYLYNSKGQPSVKVEEYIHIQRN